MTDQQALLGDVLEDDERTLCSIASIDQAQEFMEQCAPGIHPIFEDEKTKTGMTMPFKLSSETQRQAEQFLKAMESQRALTRNYSADFLDLRANHSWDDMIKAAVNAQQIYEKGNPVRKLGRVVLPYSEMAQPYLRLIPNDAWCSVLYGSLRLIFEAFAQLDERRSKVMKSFLRIPNIVMLAETCLENFPSDELLYKRAERVFNAALVAIEATTRWLKQGTTTKQFRALMLGPVYNKSFKEKLQSLDEALNELNERATVLRDQSIVEMRDTVHTVQNVVNHTDTQMLTMTEDLKHISESADATQAKVDDLREMQQIREDARKALKEVLDQKIRTAEWMKENARVLRRIEEQVKALEEIQVNLTESDLLDILDVDPDLAKQDFRSVQRSCKAAEMSHFQIAQSIFEGEKMSTWLQEDAAGALFIEGGSFGSLDRTTPLSLLCMNMVDHLQEKEPAVTVSFFCGSHTSSKDPVRGPAGIVRSLIAQVLQLYTPELNFLSRRYRHQLEILHLHTLCDCFRKLVRRLPIDTVLFCIIDGISFFETKEWAGGCKQLMSCLQELLEDNDKYPIFKLLVTSPVRSRYVGNTFPDDCRLKIASDTLNDTRHGPSERQLALMSTRPMRSAAERSAAHSFRRKHGLSKQMDTGLTGIDIESAWDDDDLLSEMEM